ncbi:nuclear pore complex protein Nup50-like [Antedon mediterranea]|uniref:nuclear pore complex protein Nup50-like n=1 Tax=Antedon mediterranea TaxID=105859 RepID=UPI003AF9BE1D
MPKREATNELTDRNWDQEDEPEEAGTFQKANVEDIQKRVIKKARRKVAGANEESTGTAFRAFKGFSGFGSTSTSARPSPMFSSSNPNGDGKPAASPFSFKPQTSKPADSKTSTGSTTLETKSSNGNHTTEYSTQLKSLNKCVLEWIQKHINQNPLCDLSPIFEDYKKHLSDIEKNSSKTEIEVSKTPAISQETTVKPSPPQQPGFSGFSFNPATTESKTVSSAFPGLGNKDNNSTVGLFGKVGSTGGFTFGQGATETKPIAFGTAANKEEDKYEPPKAEVREIKEKDALFTIRCKLFYKSGDAFKDKGVGNLHLKKTGTVAQLLIRADTNIGNIILNIGLPPNLPLQRQGKNNVMMIIPPNPPVSNKCPQCNKKYPNPQGSNVCETGCAAQPVPLLFRLKTADDADKLLEEIKKIMK